MSRKKTSLPSNIDLPDWADPRLVVRLKGNGEEYFVIDHNPHTFPGLVGLYAPSDKASLSAHPNEIIAYSEFAEGYLAGYLLGNQPDVPGSLTDTRRYREHDYFLEVERELALDEAGAIAVNARFANVSEVPFDEYGRIADLVAALGRLSSFWTEAKWIPVEEWLDPIRLSSDPGEIEQKFLWLNPGYLMSDNSVLVRELRLTNDDYGDGLPRGAVELIASFHPRGTAKLTINFETIDPMIVGLPATASDDEKFDALTHTILVAYRPDLYSISTVPALGHSSQIAVVVEDDLLFAPSGPLVYISSRAEGVDHRQLAADRFNCLDMGGGTLVRFAGDSSRFTVDDGDYLSRLLSSPESQED